MKLKEITLRGFRGFNAARKIAIHERLTLISAPNSHGKTSISEGFEWLLYGSTSKVALADSKEEYKGSYRNIHLVQPEAPMVSVVIDDEGASSEFQAVLSGTDTVRRVNGNIVPAWPFASRMGKAPKPFILQHALKDLLMAAPVERFNRFGALLGFDDLTQVHKDLMAFCTKPPLPATAKILIGDVDSLLTRVEADPQLYSVAKTIKKGPSQFAAAWNLIRKHCSRYVPASTADQDLLPTLRKSREEATSKVFRGSVGISDFTSAELIALGQEEEALASLVSKEAVGLFAELVKHTAQQRIVREAGFFELGFSLLTDSSSVCPFCHRELSNSETDDIREYHSRLQVERQRAASLEEAQNANRNLLQDVGRRVSEYYKNTASRVKGLLACQTELKKLGDLFGLQHTEHLTAVIDAFTELQAPHSSLVQAGTAVRAALQEAEHAVLNASTGELALLRVGETLAAYISAGRALRRVARLHTNALQSADKQLREQISVAAGTAGISLLIELLENVTKIQERFRILAVVEGLKPLKSKIDEFVTKIMLDAISGEMASDVMDWYRRIRTIGDPNVHFAGFDMKKTSQGGRVQIKASSYGKDLVSAVSSLSESKLNALGLCISIAVNLKEESPFEFLIIDDPIQSLDKDHEIQFISIVRELVDRGKQVVLLSHNGEWIKQVRSTCADINGFYYEITGYTESGPNIVLVPWTEPKQRLQTILAITEDQSADSIKLQQAEEELRQIFHQLACMVHEVMRGTPKSPANLNAEKCRKIFTECGIATELVNKVNAAFETIDDSHHASPNYSPNRQKLRQYYDLAVRLLQAVEAKIREAKPIGLVATSKTA